jgi:hypothetical protein
MSLQGNGAIEKMFVSALGSVVMVLVEVVLLVLLATGATQGLCTAKQLRPSFD